MIIMNITSGQIKYQLYNDNYEQNFWIDKITIIGLTNYNIISLFAITHVGKKYNIS